MHGRVAGSGRYFQLTMEPGYRLEGRVLAGAGAWPALFAIHGARSGYARLDALLLALQGLGVGSLGFNLSGHNAASPVGLAQTSLAQNLREAERFYAHWPAAQSCILGQSLGGALALRLAQAHADRVRKLVLIGPAIYPDAAYGPCFGPAFRQAIAVPFDPAASACLRFLRGFQGHVLLIHGAFDGLRALDHGQPAGRSAGTVRVAGRMRYSPIPAEVLQAIGAAVAPERLETVVLPDCDHAVSDWLQADAGRALALARRIRAFLARP